jgi:ribose 1,5-bisphosphate isomerase
MVNRKKRFNQLCKGIKSIKIQGARNVAISGLEAYNLFPTQASKKKIASLRPTEPFLINVLNAAENLTVAGLNTLLDKNQDTINKEVFKLIKTNDVIFTHCHSSTVVSALIYSKKKGKKFEVYLTETRPLFQGRKTARELKSAGINVTMFVDAAAAIALREEQGTRKADLVLLGADAITKKGTINKVGSGMFAQIARFNQIPVYILSDSLKYIPKIKLEKRPSNEMWSNHKIHIANFAFELIRKKYITGVISEFGLLPFKRFIKQARKEN